MLNYQRGIGGFHKWGYPKMMVYNEKNMHKWIFLGYLTYGNPHLYSFVP